MKKILAFLLTVTLCAGVMAACGGQAETQPQAPVATSAALPPSALPGGTELSVITSYDSDDGNRGIYEEAYKAWEAASGNTVLDNSAAANEEWKARVLRYFNNGSEPDVLFYFAFADGSPLVSEGKVVPIDEIRAEYPEYASNMDDAKVPASTVDGRLYAVPTTGFWEALFANNTVLAAANAAIPGPNTSWEEFLAVCQAVKDAGKAPIAVSLREVPHYWFEFLIMNKGGLQNHQTFPGTGETARQAWIDGLNGFKELYDLGYFNENCLTATNAEALQLMAQDRAAFVGDGSWSIGWFKDNADPDNFSVTYVPGTQLRAATEIVGGCSMGYYITRKAWENPAKREAAVDFVTWMTSDSVISRMSANNLGTNALKAPPAIEEELFDSNLSETAYQMAAGATKQNGAVQDLVAGPARDTLFASIPLIAIGQMTAQEAVDRFIQDYQE